MSHTCKQDVLQVEPFYLGFIPDLTINCYIGVSQEGCCIAEHTIAQTLLGVPPASISWWTVKFPSSNLLRVGELSLVS